MGCSQWAKEGYHGSGKVASAGMPGLSVLSGLARLISTANTLLTRSSLVCTVFGVNSAWSAMRVTRPSKTPIREGIDRDLHGLSEPDAVQLGCRDVDPQCDLAQVGDFYERRSGQSDLAQSNHYLGNQAVQRRIDARLALLHLQRRSACTCLFYCLTCDIDFLRSGAFLEGLHGGARLIDAGQGALVRGLGLVDLCVQADQTAALPAEVGQGGAGRGDGIVCCVRGLPGLPCLLSGDIPLGVRLIAFGGFVNMKAAEGERNIESFLPTALSPGPRERFEGRRLRLAT